MDETSQGSVELIEGVEMVTPHVEKLHGTMREEYLHQPCIDIHRVSGGSPGGTLLSTDLMQGHIHPQMVEEYTTHGGTEYYEHHILQEDLGDADRQLVELQAVVEEPQNLTTPVTVVGEKGEIAAMLSAYIQTTGDITSTHQIIIDSSDRSVKMFQQQRLPSLSSLPPMKKALPNSTIRSRYLRHQTHHALDEEVTLTPMTTHHTLDGTNVIVGQHIVHEDSAEGHRLLATTDAEGNTILVEDPITQKILQESANQQRLITQDNQRILVSHDSTMTHNLVTSTGGHRIATINGHRMMDVQTDHTTRYITHQEASVVTTMAGQRLITHPTQVQTQSEMDVAERLLDEESPEHQMLVQEQLIHVVLDQNAQAELGVVVPTPGQRVLLQGPEGWTTLDPAGSCEPETTDHDSRDTTTIVEIQDHQGLIVKHEEIDLAEAMVEEVEGLDGSVDGIAEGSDGDAAVDDGAEDSDFDGEGDMRTSRRSLPHKKRLSKKLRNPRKPQVQPQPLPKSVHAKCFKCNKCGEQFPTQATYAAHRVTHNVSSKKGLSFSCEICGKNLPNQLKFFEHLKAHYEPGTGVLVDQSTSANGLSGIENGSAHQKLADGNMNEATVLKDNTHRAHQHIVQLQPSSQHQQHHHPKQEQLQQHNMQALPEQEAPQPANHHQVSQQHNHRHIQRHVTHIQHQLRRHHDEPVEEQPTHQVVEMQNIILKVESEKPHHSMQQQHHLVQMPQLQNGRMRSVKNEQESLQTIQHHQRTPHHQSQSRTHQSSAHQSQQSSLQQSVLDTEPPPLVPILPPVSTITGSLNLSCHLCGKHFRRQKTLETHLSIAHPKQEDIEQFSDPEDMMEGIREVVEAGEGSDEDSESMVRLTTLTTHSADKAHSEEWYRDDDISATEADLQALQHAENEQRNEQRQGHIQQQSSTQQLEVAHMCDLCGDAFHSKARLNQHLRVEHMELRQKGKDKILEDDGDESPKGKKSLRRLACNQCDRVFNHRNSLVYHLRSHSGERPHQCEECGKSFFATSALKVHMRLHSGDKPYKCEFCGRNFRQWGDLKYHCTSRHSEEKQYQCEYCGKDFARKYSLIVHRRIHTGEKDYVCEFCQKKFRASSYLQNHRRIHTGEKPHRCEVCDKPFRVRSDMKRHMNTHNRERQRLAGANSGGNTNRSKQMEEVDEADVDAPDSQDHTSIHQNMHIHELDNTTTITVMKTDTEGTMEILPDHPSANPQSATAITLTTDAGLQYASERDPLETHHRTHNTGATQSGQLVYVLPTSYYM